MGRSYLPNLSPSALPATGVLAEFGSDFMTNYVFGRGIIAVPVAWINCVTPYARVIVQAVRLRSRMGVGQADLRGQNSVESVLYLVCDLVCMLVKQ